MLSQERSGNPPPSSSSAQASLPWRISSSTFQASQAGREMISLGPAGCGRRLLRKARSRHVM